MTYPATNIPNVAAGDFIDDTEWDELADALNFLANRPACRVTHSTTQSITSGAWAALTFNTEAFDTDAMHSTVSDTSRITATKAGLYDVSGGVAFAANGTGDRFAGIRKNGSGSGGPTEGGHGGLAASASNPTYRSYSALVKMAAGDYVELVVFQTSGGALNSTVSDGLPVFSAVWVGNG